MSTDCERDGGSLSALIVPMESRETDPREPVSREGERRIMEPLLGNTKGTSGTYGCVHETAADS